MRIVSRGRVINSAEFYKKKQRKRRIKIILLSLGFLLFVSFLVCVSRQERFQITEVVVLGVNVTDKDLVVSTVKHSLDGYYFWIIPRANAFIYPQSATIEKLFKEFPRFKSINLDLNGSYILTVTIDERIPSALYCADTSRCYFLDEDGFIFALAPSFSGTVYFIYSTEDPIENPIGNKFFTTDEFHSLSKFITSLAIFDIRPSAFKIGKDGYSLTLAGGGQLIWRKDSNLKLIYSNLEAFLSDNAIQAQKNFLERIAYLDLRVDNKVFYKFK